MLDVNHIDEEYKMTNKEYYQLFDFCTVQYENKPNKKRISIIYLKFFTFNLYFSALSSKSGIRSSHGCPSSSAIPGGYQLTDKVP